MNVVTLGARIKQEATKKYNKFGDYTLDEYIEQETLFIITSFIIGQQAVNRMKEKAIELGLFPTKVTNTFFITIRHD